MHVSESSLPLQSVRQYNFAKHHISPGFQSYSISDVARNLVGVHSARLPTAYVALHSRVRNFKTRDLRRSLYSDRVTIKLRCMRKTLHVVPLDLAPIVHKATLSQRLSGFDRIYESLEASEATITELRLRLIEAVQSHPQSTKDLIHAVNQSFRLSQKQAILESPVWCTLIKTVIKNLWEEGTLCYINTHEHWGSESRLFGYLRDFYPSLSINDLDVNEAQRRLIHYHIDSFGPVTETDIAWWSGLSRKVVRRCVEEMKDILTSVNVEDFDQPFVMTKQDLALYNDFQFHGTDWLCLLAYEDPSLKGYFDSRKRYVQPEHYNLLFNQIGEARASIILNGQVIGIWSWNKKTKKIIWDTFAPLKSQHTCMLQSKIDIMENCFNEGLAQYLLPFQQ